MQNVWISWSKSGCFTRPNPISGIGLTMCLTMSVITSKMIIISARMLYRPHILKAYDESYSKVIRGHTETKTMTKTKTQTKCLKRPTYRHIDIWKSGQKKSQKKLFRDNGLDIAKMVSPSTLRSKLSGLLLTWICAISGLLRSGCIWGAVHLLSDCSTCVAINKKRSLLHPAKGFQYQAIKQLETTTSSESYSLLPPWPKALWSPRSLGPG